MSRSACILQIVSFLVLLGCTCGDTGPACNDEIPTLPPEIAVTCSLRCTTNGYEIKFKDDVPDSVPYSHLAGMNFTGAKCVDRQPPRFAKRCPYSKVVETAVGARSAPVKWGLKADDNSGVRPKVNCSHARGDFEVGEYDIRCDARDRAGNIATCAIHISVRSPGCPPLSEPAHGSLRCDDGQFGSFCYQECEKNYDVPPGSMFPNLFVCGPTGLWTPSRVPDCVLPTEAEGLVLKSHLQMYSDVCDEVTRSEVEQGFFDLLNTSDVLTVCQWRDGCSIRNITVDCGPVVHMIDAIGMGMMDVQDGGINTVPEGGAAPADQLYWYQRPQVLSDVGRLKRRRRAPPAYARSTEYMWQYTTNVTFHFALNLSNAMLEEGATYDWLTYLGSKELYDAAVYMQTKAESNMIGFQIPGLDWEFQETPFHYEFVTPRCGVGYMPSWKTMKCSACVGGTYYNTTLQECIACPIGAYQDELARMECKPCPTGTTSEGELADNVESCH